MSEQARIVQVYRSPRRDGMYLFVDRKDDLQEVPQELLAQFGRPEPALILHLKPERPLQRSAAPEVLAAIRTKGYYLQMPPAEDEIEKQIQAAAREYHG